MSTLLVIGGSGFFGKSILSAYRGGLLEPWGVDKVNIIARSATKLSLTNPNLLNSSVALFDLDIGNCNSLPSADIIIHAAATTDAALYVHAPERAEESIVRTTSNFCQLVSQFSRNSKILYVSSGATYGQLPSKVFGVDEAFGALPVNNASKRPYSQGKRRAEQQILALGLRGLSVSIARCFAFVGPYLPLEKHYAIGNFIGNGLRGEPIKVNANHLVYRSYMHADDLSQWLLTMAINGDVTCPTYNVGSPHAIELRELASKIAERFDVSAVFSDPDTAQIDCYVPSVARAANYLNLEIKIPLEIAIDRTIDAILADA